MRRNVIANLAQDGELTSGWNVFDLIHPCRVAGTDKNLQPLFSESCGISVFLGMKVITLQKAEMYRLIDITHNPPSIRNQKEENLFQSEIRMLYNRLVQWLSAFGEEGDIYGTSDFAVRPDLLDRPGVTPPPAPHVREFAVTVLTEAFFRCPCLEAIHQFLSTDGPGYRIWIDQDFDPNWRQRIFLTLDLAQVYCTNLDETDRLLDILRKL